jgi:Holliday junction resolvasome RuvABC endonuclease subunit
MITRIAGLDLSLRGAGLVAVPVTWCGDWNRIARHTFGEKLTREATDDLKIGRLLRIASAVVDFVGRHECDAVAIEGYSFASQHSHAHALGELGGVVRHQLAEKLGLRAVTVAPHTGRKLLMGKAPMKDAKTLTRAFLTSLGMPTAWTVDEGDGFVVANCLSSREGGFAFVTAAPVEEKRTRRKAA